jgi:hypothetical protein
VQPNTQANTNLARMVAPSWRSLDGGHTPAKAWLGISQTDDGSFVMAHQGALGYEIPPFQDGARAGTS